MSQEPNKTNQTFQNDSAEGAARSSQSKADFKREPEQLGELPSGYGDMFVVARDPHWLFTYWDFDYSKLPSHRQLGLQVFRDDALEATVDINEIARNWYVPVQAANASYRVVFGYKDSQGTWHSVGEAGPTHTPPEAISTEWDTLFATVPLHLTFNLLVDVVEAAKSRGEPLAEALARLQQAALNAGSRSPNWGRAQLQMLETLFGKELLTRLSSMESSELSAFLRTDISSQTSSESASELAAKSRLAQVLVPPESSLFSGLMGPGVSSENVSSLGVPSSAAEFSGALAAGSEARLQASEILSSWRSALASESMLAKQVSSAEFLSQLSSLGLSSAELAAAISSVGISSAELAVMIRSVGISSEQFAAAISSVGISSEQVTAAISSFGISSEQFAAAISSFGISSEQFAAAISSVGISSEQFAAAISSVGISSEQFAAAISSFGISSEQFAAAISSVGISSEQFAAAISSFGISSAELFSQFGVSSERFGALQLAALEMGGISSEILSSAWSASWGGLEFGPSSWSELFSVSSLFSGFGASWGGESFGLAQREFFMHVNAEVIFYGGTHPAAKVTVGGQPIQLQPDGTFRYHFIFPDKDFEIPIVAVSPDGKETRSATLFFRRETTRQSDVGHMAQPPYLAEPMGAIDR